jgi:hypothetical protein
VSEARKRLKQLRELASHNGTTSSRRAIIDKMTLEILTEHEERLVTIEVAAKLERERRDNDR